MPRRTPPARQRDWDRVTSIYVPGVGVVSPSLPQRGGSPPSEVPYERIRIIIKFYLYYSLVCIMARTAAVPSFVRRNPEASRAGPPPPLGGPEVLRTFGRGENEKKREGSGVLK